MGLLDFIYKIKSLLVSKLLVLCFIKAEEKREGIANI